jgi:ACS family hexuronate transporter-like MFS transporter
MAAPPPVSTSAADGDIPASAADTPVVAAAGRHRWTICALLFFATTINYMDRQVLGILAPDLGKSIGWNEAQYGNIVAAFQGAYAIGLVTMGHVLDKIGTRKGFVFAICAWSVAAMAHALARTPFGFGVARFALGLGESGNFPAAIKTVAEWFPKKERALATGIFNSGSNVGAIISPLLVPFLAIKYGWEWAFIVTGALGFIWLFFWLTLYHRPEDHPKVSQAELAYIAHDRGADQAAPNTNVPWASLLGYRQTWAFALGKFLTDPVWWFYLSWLPKFLNKTYGLTLDKIGPPLIVIYLAADFGSIGGGWLSSSLLRRGVDVNVARKTAMLVCALCVVPILFASRASNLWVAVGLISLAAAAHQGWSANLFTLVSDMFPRRAVGSVTGFGGMAGAIGGMFVASAVGWLLQTTGGNYVPLFFIGGFAYLVALAVIHALVPRLSPVHITDQTR